MQRSSMIPRPPYQPVPRGPMVFKSVIPERKLDESIINKLFLLASEGDYMRLKEYMVNNNIALTSKNDKAESILHVVMKNVNITQREKLELVKLCVTNGAQVNSYDMNNVTPLHIAAKLQHDQIVKYMLSVGANLEAKDSQYKTPLFYAISGNSTQCPAPNEDKVRPIIPLSAKQKKTKGSNMSKVYSEMVKYMHTNKNINQYLTHIENTFYTVPEMYEEIKEQNDADKITITEIIADSTLPEKDKKAQIFDKLMENRKTLNDTLTQKLGDATSAMIIKQNTEDGWGPSGKLEHKILEYKDETVLTNFIVGNAVREYDQSKSALDILVQSKINDKIKALTEYVNEWKIMQNDILMYTAQFKIHNTRLDPDPWPLMNDTKLGANFHSNKAEYYDGRNYIYRNLNLLDDTDSQTVNAQYVTQTDRSILAYRKTQNELRELKKKRGVNMEDYKFFLTGDKQWVHDHPRLIFQDNAWFHDANNANANVQVVVPNHIVDHTGTLVPSIAPQVAASLNAQLGGAHQYFISVLEQYTANLVAAQNEIYTTMGTLQTEYSNQRYNTLYEAIGDITIKLLEMCLILIFVEKFLDENKIKLDALTNYPKPDTARPHYCLYEQLHMRIGEMVKTHEKTAGVSKEFYIIIKNTVDALNSVISAMNAKMAADHVISFGHAQFNVTQFTSTPTMNKPMKKIKELPAKFELFTQQLLAGDPGDTNKNKTYLFKTYMHQITDDYAPILYAGADAAKTNGYVYNLGGPHHFPGVPGEMIVKAVMQTKNTVPANKTQSLYPISGHFLHAHFRLIKYIIIKYIIEQTALIFDPPAPPVPSTILGTLLEPELTKIKGDIDKLIKDADSNGVLYVLLAKMVDSILSEFIKMHISNITTIIQKKLLGENNQFLYDAFLAKGMNRRLQMVKKGKIDALPLDKDDGFSLEMDELFESLMDQYKSVKPRLVTMIGDLGEEPTSESKKVHKIVNFIYDGKSLESLCFKIDPEVTALLLKSGAYANAKDILGNTPLYYANEIQHMDLIKLLLEHKAVVYSARYRNVRGESVLSTSWKNYCDNVIPLMVQTSDITASMTKTIIKKFKKKTQYGNNVPRYVNLLLPICIYLLNHQLYLVGKGYPLGWTYEHHKRLCTKLEIKESIMPLLDINPDDIKFFGTKHTDLSVSHLNWLDKQIEAEENALVEYQHKHANLSKELDVIKKSKDDDSMTRQNVLEDTLLELNEKINKAKTNIQRHKIRKERIETYTKPLQDTDTDTIFVKPYRKPDLTKLTKHDAVADMYDAVFKKIINNIDDAADAYTAELDLKTYASIWKVYMKDATTLRDGTQIINSLFAYQDATIKRLSTKSESVLKSIKEMSLVANYYKLVLMPYIDNYFELPQELDTVNYPLIHTVKIITHVAKHFIFVNLYHIIVKMIIKYVIERSQVAVTKKTQYVHDTVMEILNNTRTSTKSSGPPPVTTTTKSSRLMTYIMNDMPWKAVKCTLQLFEGEGNGEGDIDRETNIDKLFAHITKILEANTTMPMTKDSSVIKNLNEYIYPFFKDYIELFVKEMKSVMDGYLRTLKYQGQHLEIMQMLSEHVKQEA